jgi:uncharacterized OsmC-like protein
MEGDGGGPRRFGRPSDLDEEDPFSNICDVHLEHLEMCKFDATFVQRDGDHLLDAPLPLGVDHGPEAVTMFTTAAAYCMAASLTYYLRKARVEPEEMSATGHAEMRLTEHLYRRVGSIEIFIRIVVSDKERKRLERALTRFTDFCIVTESIRGSFPVRVSVEHPWGKHEVVLD